jgi:CDP-diacylglycerol--serine O-phosphatidyltransferase
MIAKTIPNLFTIGNLFLGIVAIIFVFHEKPELAVILVIAAMLTDGLDGRVARALKVQSDFGKELDSLSDVISFGVAPAFITYVVAFQDIVPTAAGWLVTAVFPICGALRLARFNVKSTSSPGYFVGLPVPAAGGILCTLALFHSSLPTVAMIIVTLLLSYLMVSNITYPSFKQIRLPKSMLWVATAVLVAVIALAAVYPNRFTKWLFIPLVLYALYGLKKNISRRVRRAIRQTSELELELEESYR